MRRRGSTGKPDAAATYDVDIGKGPVQGKERLPAALVMRSRSLRDRRELEKIIMAAVFFAVAGDQRFRWFRRQGVQRDHRPEMIHRHRRPACR